MEFENGCFEEGCLNDKVDRFGGFSGLNAERGELYDHKGGKVDEGCDDFADLLPGDPFGMGISTKGSGVAAIASCLEDFEKDLGFKADEVEVSGVDDQLFAEHNFVLTGTMRISPDDGNCEVFGMDFGEGLGKCLIVGDIMSNDQGGKNDNCDTGGVDHSYAMLLALGYLGLGELLAVEGVCKSLRDVVRGDPLLWRSIHVDHPFSTKITDDILIKLTNRAQGHLHSLSLVWCSKITDDGLKHVLERNPSLTKLSVPRCVGLTIDGILSNLKVLKSAEKSRLKYLGIYGLPGLEYQHIEEFKRLVGVDNSKLPTTRKPRFFAGSQLYVNSDDDRVMDIEVCPKCQLLGLVYDCPLESCQKKQSASQLCRGCTLCITRCMNCGCCLNNCEYEELFSFELLCLDCWIQLLGCQEREQKMTFSPKARHVYLCG